MNLRKSLVTLSALMLVACGVLETAEAARRGGGRGGFNQAGRGSVRYSGNYQNQAQARQAYQPYAQQNYQNQAQARQAYQPYAQQNYQNQAQARQAYQPYAQQNYQNQAQARQAYQPYAQQNYQNQAQARQDYAPYAKDNYQSVAQNYKDYAPYAKENYSRYAQNYKNYADGRGGRPPTAEQLPAVRPNPGRPGNPSAPGVPGGRPVRGRYGYWYSGTYTYALANAASQAPDEGVVEDLGDSGMPSGAGTSSTQRSSGTTADIAQAPKSTGTVEAEITEFEDEADDAGMPTQGNRDQELMRNFRNYVPFSEERYSRDLPVRKVYAPEWISNRNAYENDYSDFFPYAKAGFENDAD